MPQPDILQRLRDLESRLAYLEGAGAQNLTAGTLDAYDGVTNTATVTVDGLTYAGIPVAYGISAWAARAGVNVGAICGVVGFNAAAPTLGCVVYITSVTPPPDPFSPVTGHKHTGRIDDGPVLP